MSAKVQKYSVKGGKETAKKNTDNPTAATLPSLLKRLEKKLQNKPLVERLRRKITILPTAEDYWTMIRFVCAENEIEEDGCGKLRLSMALATYADWQEYLSEA